MQHPEPTAPILGVLPPSAEPYPARKLAGVKLTVIEGESTDCWQALVEACHRVFQPETKIETELVAARWRLRRCWSMETSLLI